MKYIGFGLIKKNIDRRSVLRKFFLGLPFFFSGFLSRKSEAGFNLAVDVQDKIDSSQPSPPNEVKQTNSSVAKIKDCHGIEILRITEPTYEGELINLIGYYKAISDTSYCPYGGGLFRHDTKDFISADNGGSIIVTVSGNRWKRCVSQLLPVHFGCIPGAKIDSTKEMQSYINACNNRVVNICDGPWLITSTIDFTHVSKIISDRSGSFIVDPDFFQGSWAITIGKPGRYNENRCSLIVIEGTLRCKSKNRNAKLNGVYIKGSLLNIGHVRTENFNGIGIYQDSVWDSTTQRLSSELCGNIEDPQIKISSAGDTHNASHILSLQSEQAYHFSLYINILRDVIDNIHAERTYILSLDDGSQLNSSLKYRNVFILMGNSVINQAFLDASSLMVSPDGLPIKSNKLSVQINADYSSVSSLNIPGGSLSTNFGHLSRFNVVTCDSWYLSEPVNKLFINELKVNNLTVSSNIHILNGIIKNIVSIQSNTENVFFENTNITKLESRGGSASNIKFINCYIKNIETLGEAKLEGYGYFFENCDVDFLSGSPASYAIFRGGKIGCASLARNFGVELFNLYCDTFDYSSPSRFITNNVNVRHCIKWSLPGQDSYYPAGTTTFVLGYIISGQPYGYINTDGKSNWRELV